MEMLRECGLIKKAEDKLPPDAVSPEGGGGMAVGARCPTLSPG